MRRITLTKKEVDALKDFCDDNLERGTIIIDQDDTPNGKPLTRVMVTGVPETFTDITDIDYYYVN